MESKDLRHTLSKAFDVSKATAKVSPKRLREDDNELVRKARRSQLEHSFRNPNWRSERRIKVDRCLRIFLLRKVSKALERQESKAIGR